MVGIKNWVTTRLKQGPFYNFLISNISKTIPSVFSVNINLQTYKNRKT